MELLSVANVKTTILAINARSAKRQNL